MYAMQVHSITFTLKPVLINVPDLQENFLRCYVMVYVQMPDSSDKIISISSAKLAIFGEIC